MNQTMQAMLDKRGISMFKGKPYCPQTQGKVERNNYTGKQVLERLCVENKVQISNWQKVVKEFNDKMNEEPIVKLGLSQAALLSGIFIDSITKTKITLTDKALQVARDMKLKLTKTQALKMLKTGYSKSAAAFIKPGLSVYVKQKDFFRSYGKRKHYNESGMPAVHPFRATIVEVDAKKTHCSIKWVTKGWGTAEPGDVTKNVGIHFLHPKLEVSQAVLDARETMGKVNAVMKDQSPSRSAGKQLDEPSPDPVLHTKCAKSYSLRSANAESKNRAKKRKQEAGSTPKVKSSKKAELKVGLIGGDGVEDIKKELTPKSQDPLPDSKDCPAPVTLSQHIYVGSWRENSCWMDTLLFLLFSISKVMIHPYHTTYHTELQGTIATFMKKMKAVQSLTVNYPDTDITALRKQQDNLRGHLHWKFRESNDKYGFMQSDLGRNSMGNMTNAFRLVFDARTVASTIEVLEAEKQFRACPDSFNYPWIMHMVCPSCGPVQKTNMEFVIEAIRSGYISPEKAKFITMANIVTQDPLINRLKPTYKKLFETPTFRTPQMMFNLWLRRLMYRTDDSVEASPKEMKIWNQALQCPRVCKASGELCGKIRYVKKVQVDAPKVLIDNGG